MKKTKVQQVKGRGTAKKATTRAPSKALEIIKRIFDPERLNSKEALEAFIKDGAVVVLAFQRILTARINAALMHLEEQPRIEPLSRDGALGDLLGYAGMVTELYRNYSVLYWRVRDIEQKMRESGTEYH